MSSPLTLRVLDRIDAVPAEAWNDLTTALTHPLVRHEWLLALEEGGVATAANHWQPAHRTLWAQGRLVAAMPCYLRTSDDGEWVHQVGVRLGAEKAGFPYFPRLVSAIPVTPVPGERILVGRAGPEAAPALRRLLARSLVEEVEKKTAASAHLLFCTEDEAALLGSGQDVPWLTRRDRHHCYVHQGAGSWEEWLAAQPRKRRQAIRRERRGVREAGVEVAWFAGTDAADSDWDEMAELYAHTSRRWGVEQPILPLPFFRALGQRARAWVQFAEARRGGRRIALALYTEGGGQLSGRYWGTREELPFLHFELCFYSAIERSIQRGIPIFNPGHGGEHKELRGLTPVVVHGLHHHSPPGFHQGVIRWTRRLGE